jgi:hypothetical protein
MKPFVVLGASVGTFVFASMHQDQATGIPDEFSSPVVSDSVTSMMGKIKAGNLSLEYEPKQGYLRAVLKQLGISLTSQILVFSKTSLQANFISPTTPRALYFNDHAYVGWIPNAPYIELISIDPLIGPVFYMLANRKGPSPVISRQTLECFQCHFTPMTGQVPGLMARSVYAGPDGVPRFANGSFRTTATSPMKERWGGWYVTGQHGDQRHMGNEVARGDEQASTIDTAKGANVVDLGRYFGVDRYLSSHSDIVALMVFEQQLTIQNAITKAGFLTRKAEKDGLDLLKFGFTAQHVEEEIHERVAHACEPVVKAMLGSEEPALASPIKGTSGFASAYSQSSPADRMGRRLSDLDLRTKLLKYSCSPMVYSAAFDGLPHKAKEQIYHRFNEIFSGMDTSPSFVHLTKNDRQTVKEILIQTKSDLAPYFVK